MTPTDSGVGFWSEAAARWVDDEERVEHIGGPLGLRTMDHLELRPGLRVFDVGCGTGSTDDPRAAFANLRRVLRLDGRLGFVAWQDLQSNDWMGIPAAAAGSALGTSVPLPLAGERGPFAFSDPQRIRDVLEAAGFRDIKVLAHNDHLEVPTADVMAYAAGSTTHGGIRAVLANADRVGIPPLAGRLVMKLEGTAVPIRGVRTRRGWCGSVRCCTR